MQKLSLNPDSLTVETFATVRATAPKEPSIIIADPNDPTAATWCFVCPVETVENCF